MPNYFFALETGSEKRLEISWVGSYKNVTISLDGNSVGTIPDQKALSAGKEFTLPDGSTVKAQLVGEFITAELQLLRNGKPLPGSPSDPEVRVKNASLAVYYVAGLDFALGLLALLAKNFSYQNDAINVSSIITIFIFSLLFFILGFLTQQKSTIALRLAMIIVVANGIWGLVLPTPQYNNTAVATGIIVGQALFLIPTIRGLRAIKSLKA